MRHQWEHFSHAADIGIRGFGKTMAEAFSMGAMALIAVMTDPAKIKPLITIDIHCEAPDSEILFLDWINALVYEMETRDLLFCEFTVTIEHLRLSAVIKGEKLDRNRHQPAVQVKGATFTELKVYNEKQRWIAQCVVDV